MWWCNARPRSFLGGSFWSISTPTVKRWRCTRNTSPATTSTPAPTATAVWPKSSGTRSPRAAASPNDHGRWTMDDGGWSGCLDHPPSSIVHRPSSSPEVAGRKAGEPVPGGADDSVYAGELGAPAQLVLGQVGAGDQDRRVGGAARRFDGRDLTAGDAAGGRDDLAHGIAAAVAQVVDPAAAVDRAEREDMRVGEVDDVNVVADASAVGGWIVGAVDLDPWPPPEAGLEDEWDQVALGVVVLAEAL